MSNTKTKTIKNRGKEKAFTLIELLVTVAIIVILGFASYLALSGSREKTFNTRVKADIQTIVHALRAYQESENVLPEPSGVVNFFTPGGQYAHSNSGTYIIQGIVNKNLIPPQFLSRIPRDPRNNHYYVFSKTLNNKYFQVAGVIFEGETPKTYLDGEYPLNLTLKSIIPEHNGPEFVTNGDPDHLPYNPNEFAITATIRNMSDANNVKVLRQGQEPEVALNEGDEVFAGDILKTNASTAMMYFSDGTTSVIKENSTITIKNLVLDDDNSHHIHLDLNIGEIWHKASTILAGNSEFNTDTDTTITAVRGTVVGIKIINGTTNVTLNVGKVDVTPKDKDFKSKGTEDKNNDNSFQENPDGTVTYTLVSQFDDQAEAFGVNEDVLPIPNIEEVPKTIYIPKSIRPTIYKINRNEKENTILNVRAPWMEELNLIGFHVYVDDEKIVSVTDYETNKKGQIAITIDQKLIGKITVSAYSDIGETGQSIPASLYIEKGLFSAELDMLSGKEGEEIIERCGNNVVDGDINEVCDGGSGVFKPNEKCKADCTGTECKEGFEYDENDNCVPTDNTPPEVVLSTKAIPGEPDGPDGLNEWRNTNVEIEITCTDDNGCQFTRWELYTENPESCPVNVGGYSYMYSPTASENNITAHGFICMIGVDEYNNKKVEGSVEILIDSIPPEKPTLTVDKQDTGNTITFSDLIDATSSVKDVYFLFAEITRSDPPFNTQVRNNGIKYSEYSQNPISYTQQLTVYYIAEDEAGNLTDVFSEKMCLKNEEYNPDVPGCVSTLLEAQCINDGTRTGNPARPANARWNDITYNEKIYEVDEEGYFNQVDEGGEYVPSTDLCSWSCDSDFTEYKNTCYASTQTVRCADNKSLYKIEEVTVSRWLDIGEVIVNYKNTTGEYTQTFNSEDGTYEPSPGQCDFECLTDDMGVEKIGSTCVCKESAADTYYNTDARKCHKPTDCANSPKAPKPSDTYWYKPTNPQVAPEGGYEAYWNVNQYAPNLAVCDWACGGDKNKVSYNEKDICIEQNLLFEANFDEGNAEAYYAAGGEGSPIEDSANNLYQNGTVQVNEKLGYMAYGNINGDEGTVEMVVNGEEITQASGKMLFFLGDGENRIRMYIFRKNDSDDLVLLLRKDDTSPTRSVTISNLDLPNQNYIIRAAWKKSTPFMKLKILDLNYNLVGSYQASTSLSPDDFPTILADYRLYVGGHPTSTTRVYANKNIDRIRIYHIFR